MMYEQELVKAVQGCIQQEGACQQQVFRHYYNYVMTIASRYAPQRADAEEILSDAFFRAFSRIETYNPAFAFKPWLGKVVVNCAINHFQKYHRKDVFFEELETANHIPHQHFDAVSSLSFEELKVMIASLPPAYRMVFNLYVIEGYKHEEIADMLQINVGTSKSNLSKARQKMQRMIEVVSF